MIEPSDAIRIMIADDHPVVREGLAALIISSSNFLIGASTTNKQTLPNKQGLPQLGV
jgi:DNA-binding NarL/FixJ family response regulator